MNSWEKQLMQHILNEKYLGENEERPKMRTDEKKSFLEAVANYHRLGEMIYAKRGLKEVTKTVQTIVEKAEALTMQESEHWFDNVTVSRHMKQLKEAYKVFEKTSGEMSGLQQRLEAAYDDMGSILGRYYNVGNSLNEDDDQYTAGVDDEGPALEEDAYTAGVDDEGPALEENAKKRWSSRLNEGDKNIFSSQDDMFKTWESKLKKPNNLFCKNIAEWDLYRTLEKKKPHQGDKIKIQKTLFKYGIIDDKSWFNGPNGVWEVYTVTHLISNDVMKLQRRESGGHRYTDLLYIKDHGIYRLGGNGYNRDINEVPDEYKVYATSLNEGRRVTFKGRVTNDLYNLIKSDPYAMIFSDGKYYTVDPEELRHDLKSDLIYGTDEDGEEYEIQIRDIEFIEF